MKVRPIWIWASNAEDARHLKKIFDEVNLLNPITFLDTHTPFRASELTTRPIVALLDLSLPNDRAWEILAEARNITDGELRFLALIQPGEESILDRAYDAGVKSYLVKPFTFMQFIERARLLQLNSLLSASKS